MRVTDLVTFFAAFSLSGDFRAYVRDRGWRVSMRRRRVPFHEIELSYGPHRYDAVPAQTDWSVFGADKEFRPNDLFREPEDEGRLRSLSLATRWDNRRDFRDGDL